MTVAEKLQKIAENEQKIYEAGRQAEYDAFWDAVQDNGKRTDYSRAFASGWRTEMLNPKHPIRPTDATYMFYNSRAKSISSDAVFDFSQCTNFYYMFSGASIGSVDFVIDTRSANNLGAMFGWTSGTLESIEKIILKDDGSQSVGSMFAACAYLKEVRFEGFFGKSINFQWSPLSRESIISVVYALSDSANGQTATFNRSAVNTAFETSEGAADGSTSEAWLSLVATKSNWTISLV